MMPQSGVQFKPSAEALTCVRWVDPVDVPSGPEAQRDVGQLPRSMGSASRSRKCSSWGVVAAGESVTELGGECHLFGGGSPGHTAPMQVAPAFSAKATAAPPKTRSTVSRWVNRPLLTAEIHSARVPIGQ